MRVFCKHKLIYNFNSIYIFYLFKEHYCKDKEKEKFSGSKSRNSCFYNK